MSAANLWLSPDWPAPENIHAATTLRNGGVSCGGYTSLNPALHVGDDAERVGQNRKIIRNLLNLPGDPVWLDQVHSNRVVHIENPPLAPFVKGGDWSDPFLIPPLQKDFQQADASYTTESGVVCAVMTADCLPLLVCTSDGSHVAAIHAGWRGLLSGVIGNTLAAMTGDFLVWLGPAIGPDCFEVGAEVRTAFREKSTAFLTAFKEKNNGKWLADIYQLARIELAMRDIDKVYGGDFCTVTEHERFYSYRRDKQTGRMATLIWRT